MSIGSQGGELDLTINEALLTQFNEKNKTNLKLLPQELFTIIDKKIILAKGDYRAFFKIELDTEGIALLKAESGYQYGLPCEVSVAPGTTLEQGEDEVIYSIIVPVVKKPYIELEKTGLLNGVTVIDLRSPEKTPFFTEVQINYNNEWDLDFMIAVESNLVTQYNTDHNTDYKMINEAAFKIDPSSLVIPKNTNKSPMKITFLKDGFVDSKGQYVFDEYLLPIRIATVSKNGINPEKDVQYIPVSFRPLLLDRSQWKILDWNSCICEEPQYLSIGRVPENLLDGNTETFWGSKWDAPKPLPYYFIFDMKKENTLYQIELIKPTNTTWRGNIKTGYFAVSSDNENWTKIKEWEIENNTPRKHSFKIGGVKARYVKLVITDAFIYANSGLTPESGAQCDLAEFVVWGE